MIELTPLLSQVLHRLNIFIDTLWTNSLDVLISLCTAENSQMIDH